MWEYTGKLGTDGVSLLNLEGTIEAKRFPPATVVSASLASPLTESIGVEAGIPGKLLEKSDARW
jgi:hypothetical protein